MRNLTIYEYMGLATFTIGLLVHFSLGIVYGVWKPYIKKVSLSQAEFAKVTRLMWIFSIVAGAGFMMIIVWGNSAPADWFSRIFFGLICLGIYPAFQTGIFIRGMKRKGFVRRTCRENGPKAT